MKKINLLGTIKCLNGNEFAISTFETAIITVFTPEMNNSMMLSAVIKLFEEDLDKTIKLLQEAKDITNRQKDCS